MSVSPILSGRIEQTNQPIEGENGRLRTSRASLLHSTGEARVNCRRHQPDQ